MKNPWVLIGALAVVLIGASIWYSNYVGEQANEGVSFEPHVLGNAEADVVLVEYSDFQCPACGQFAPIVKDVIDEYGEQLRFEYRHFPLTSIHPFAVPAARAAEAAGQQGEFFAMHDLLFENQSNWSNSGNPTVFFNQYAEEIGLDMDLFSQHMKASLITDKINEEFSEARERGFTGTPTFTLNGEQMTFNTFEEFITQIEAAIGIEATSTEEMTEDTNEAGGTSTEAVEFSL